jgi:lipid-binding SYLF domain-containing protein
MNSLSKRFAAAVLLTALSSSGLFAASKTYREKLVDKLNACEYTLQVVMSKAETAVPAKLLHDAKGVIVVHEYRAGLIFGGQSGSAVLVARIPSTGAWGPPVFLDPGGFNVGLQAGVKEINTVFVLNTDEAVRRAYSGRFNLGADAFAVAGPKAAETDNLELFKKADVFVYTSTGGLYAGATVKTGWISPNDRANREFYHTPFATPEIVLSTWFTPPPEAQNFMKRLRNAEAGKTE